MNPRTPRVPPDLAETLSNVLSAIEILQEKYPALKDLATPYQEETATQWMTSETSANRLAKDLQGWEDSGWEIFQVLPNRNTTFTIVVRKEYVCRAKSSEDVKSSPNSSETPSD